MKKVIYPVLIMLSITTMAVMDGCGLVRKPARFFALGMSAFFIFVILFLMEIRKLK